jgi:hypothetical protein
MPQLRTGDRTEPYRGAGHAVVRPVTLPRMDGGARTYEIHCNGSFQVLVMGRALPGPLTLNLVKYIDATRSITAASRRGAMPS